MADQYLSEITYKQAIVIFFKETSVDDTGQERFLL
jgi:hypothetical protein